MTPTTNMIPLSAEEVNVALSKTFKSKDTLTKEKVENLNACIALGRQLSLLAKEFPSTKLRGLERARRFPESESLDPAQRTHCKWLYEALHERGHSDNDILQVLGVESIYDLCAYSGNPTVIHRDYKKLKAQAA